MCYQAVIFDRDGVLTYFDPALIGQRLAPLLPISVQALVLRWDDWGDLHGFPTTPEEEHELVDLFWRDLSREFDLSPSNGFFKVEADIQ